MLHYLCTSFCAQTYQDMNAVTCTLHVYSHPFVQLQIYTRTQIGNTN